MRAFRVRVVILSFSLQRETEKTISKPVLSTSLQIVIFLARCSVHIQNHVRWLSDLSKPPPPVTVPQGAEQAQPAAMLGDSAGQQHHEQNKLHLMRV